MILLGIRVEKEAMERPILRKAIMPIVALDLACSVIAQAEKIGTGRGMKTDIISESEYLKLEQAIPHCKSQKNSAALPAGSENYMTVKDFAEFEVSGLQMPSFEGQIMDVSYSTVSAVIPESYYLSAYYRNPSDPETKAGFHLHRAARVDLSDCNLLCQWVNTLAEGELSQVEHFVSWDGRNYQGSRQPSGVYFCRINSEMGSIKRKMVLVN